ncbi:HNH endonuclease family protein [Streptomyces sp. NE06-03E]|uniref:HNH endonuclease family protein n=1 Tax=Streptomyces sp. NBC_00148 TaxID=2903626 RepID=A0AAU1LQ95_9ACTN|nr:MULTISPECIES: HNH endonuclease family protein [unclassified Streptomyces]WSS61602.1 HNH endonuclease family protein [Streptomyces sp. NBC_01177]WSS68655.1 HNH endonuclease family protein [Streptomyces sp. NBC_01175]WSS75664.1 HNH endonuclease family protein [Streptomyces sp. NBC_01174]MDX3057171.1 HNH endonuclease family protein [Streptomyces sp. NE06-03E]MDX3430278.1 HNH endonuclease family protein [Streptomyces sp. ME01-18a]
MSGIYARRIAVLAASAALAATTGLLTAPTAQAAMPTPVAASTARTYLSQLTVSAEGSSSGYSRDKFPHWITQSGACNTREVVLKRDGTGVVQDSSCAATSGSWYSEYDGATWTAAADLDIDHMVPLAEAWRSGASGWTTAQRQSFANDLTRPQLIAVTDNVNQSKSDQDPGEWLPSRAAYRCTYARAWVHVKHYYGLSVDTTEKSALQSVLNGC